MGRIMELPQTLLLALDKEKGLAEAHICAGKVSGFRGFPMKVQFVTLGMVGRRFIFFSSCFRIRSVLGVRSIRSLSMCALPGFLS